MPLTILKTWLTIALASLMVATAAANTNFNLQAGLALHRSRSMLVKKEPSKFKMAFKGTLVPSSAAGAAAVPAVTTTANYRRVTVANYCGKCACPCADKSADTIVHFVFTPVLNASRDDMATRSVLVKHCGVVPAFNTAASTFHFYAESADASRGDATIGSYVYPTVDFERSECTLDKRFTQVRTPSGWTDFKMNLLCEEPPMVA